MFMNFISMSKFRKSLLSVLFAVGILGGAYYLWGSASTEASSQVLLSTVTRGDLSTSVSASGQVSDAQEIELQMNTSGTIATVYVEEGDTVAAGQLLLALDATDAAMSIREAEVSLAQAKLDLEELNEGASEADIKRAQNEVTQAQSDLSDLLNTYDDAVESTNEDIQDLQDSLPDAYDSAYNEAIAIFSELPDVLADLEALINGNDFSRDHSNLTYYVLISHDQDLAEDLIVIEENYETVLDLYEDARDSYADANRDDYESLASLVNDSYATMEDLSELLKDLDLYLTLANEDLGEDFEYHNELTEDRSTVTSAASLVNPLLNSIDDELNNIDDIDDAIETAQEKLLDLASDYEENKASAELTLEEKELDLEDLTTSDVTDLDIRAQELVIEQRQNSLNEAQESYQDCFLYAPIAGRISSMDLDAGEQLASGTAMTLVDDAKQIVISFNELDISDLNVGQSATVTFDAIDDLVAEATVVEKSLTGTVNSGVVTYDVILALDTEDERILTGMSADVEVILSSAENVLVIPLTAIKTDEQGSYVDLVTNADSLTESPFYDPTLIEREKTYVELGQSNDQSQEILSGLAEGDKIVMLTATTTEESEEEESTSEFGSGGGGDFGPSSGGGGPPSGSF